MNDSVVKSVGRVFEVLELFDAERVALSATSVARSLKYPASSTVALLKSMVTLGYLTYDNIDRTYFPTVRLALIGSWLEKSFFVEGHLFELLDEIAAASEEAVFLSWPADLEVQYVRVRGTLHLPGSESCAGSRLPLFSSVTGLTALSQKRDVEIVKLVERLNQQRRKQEQQVDLASAMEQIRRFRTLGYGVGYDGVVPGFGTLAWILRQKGAARSIIISVVGPSERLKAREKNLVHSIKAVLQRTSTQ
jgi:DNA-binding IclR family transcriptional regulator